MTQLIVRAFDDEPDNPKTVVLELDRDGNLVLFAEPTTSIAVKGFEIPKIAEWLKEQELI